MTKSDLVKRLAAANPHLHVRDLDRIVATVLDPGAGRTARAQPAHRREGHRAGQGGAALQDRQAAARTPPGPRPGASRVTAGGDRSPAGGETRRDRPGARAVDLEVARRVRQRRLALGMTLQRLAELVGVTYQQVRKYETGINRVSAGLLHRIAQALGVEVGHFLAAMDAEGHGPAEPAGAPGQRRRLLELVRHVAGIGDRRHREALCRLARELAALGGEDAPSSAPRMPGRPRRGPGSTPP
jgi:transcriptional regulator with XRE-family HTH domain